MKKPYRDGRKILVCYAVVNFCWFILKTNIAKKRSMENQLLSTVTLNTLQLAFSFSSIIYKLITLLINGTLVQI